MKLDQLERERSPQAEVSPPPVSGIKSILVHVQNDRTRDSRLEAALALARSCEAHLTCLHVTPIEAYVAFDNFGGIFVMEDVIKTIDEEASRISDELQAKLRGEDVSWDYVEVTGNIPGQLISHAALTDLLVTGREPHRADFAGSTIGLLGDVLYRARTPLFIPADNGGAPDISRPALIAWDGSYEAANTVRASLGLLRLASDVRILQIREKSDEAFPGTKLLEYLSRHGIHAELSIEDLPSRGDNKNFVAGALLAHAQGIRAGYILMGGYNHSRLGEYVFGGVTRAFLKSSPVPLVIGH